MVRVDRPTEWLPLTGMAALLAMAPDAVCPWAPAGLCHGDGRPIRPQIIIIARIQGRVRLGTHEDADG